MVRVSRCFCWVMGAILLTSASAEAHPISMTQADAYATRSTLKVSIDLFVEDLFLFHNLQPTEENTLAFGDIAAAMEKHKAFLLERFIVRDADGVPLEGKVAAIDSTSVGTNDIPMTELMAHSLVYQLEYPLAEGTDFLTFQQQMGSTTFGFPAVMLLRLKQEGSEVPYVAEMRSGEPQTIHLDWDHPPLSEDASEKEWEEWEAVRREKSLGITSYSSVYSFLYIEPGEVRHEILVPLLTVEASLPIPRAETEFLTVDEQESARPAIGEFFGKANPIVVDGATVEPIVDRIDFYGLDFKDFAKKAEQKRVGMSSARVGVILSYPLDRDPKTVQVTWDFFNKYVWGAQTVVFAKDQSLNHFFSPYQKTFEWTNPAPTNVGPIDPIVVTLPAPARRSISWASAVILLIGVLAIWRSRARWSGMLGICLLTGLLAAGLRNVGVTNFADPLAPTPTLADDESKEVFQRLHQNIYRAFENRQEEKVYDALSASLAGPLLERVYLDIRKGLVMEEQGGAVARVSDVRLLDAKRSNGPAEIDPRGFAIEATWDVSGTVEHWGHVHTRTNEYQAKFVVEPTASPEGKATWKIVSMDVGDQKRKSFETRIRSFE